MLDLAARLVAVYGPSRERLYANRVLLDYLGLSLEECARGNHKQTSKSLAVRFYHCELSARVLLGISPIVE